MKESDFLQFIYNEDLYIINEPAVSIQASKNDENFSQEVDPQALMVEESKPVTFFGNNEKRILILIHDSTNKFLNQNDLDFLMKIVESGLRYSKNDFALVNTAVFPLEQIMEEVEYDYLISFGITNQEFISSKKLYEVHENEGIEELFADNLSEIGLDKQKKILLWNSLKSMFKI